MKTKRIVITGGPGTGKTALINCLLERNYYCFEEVSRAVILKAQKQGIDQLFLEKPLRFSELLLKGRTQQYKDAKSLNVPFAFYDRGIPDIVAYMDYIKVNYSNLFKHSCKKYVYDVVFMLKPWKSIYKQDNERYESFEEAEKIYSYLKNTYTTLGYNIINLPLDSIKNRADYIIKTISKL